MSILKPAAQVAMDTLPTDTAKALVKFRRLAMVNKTLIFCTAVSGAFVAGLDAGLTYNSFPLMAGKVIPDDLFAFAPWLSNFTENPTTVQFDHRILGTSTLAMITYVTYKARRLPLPPGARMAVNALFFMGCTQVKDNPNQFHEFFNVANVSRSAWALPHCCSTFRYHWQRCTSLEPS